ncbi:hypothetical protein B5P43_18255 [Bacillus sp. SRB_336]|nr:hypothetical protein B5P43_18255 [Bacillus sp. SRB_336]
MISKQKRRFMYRIKLATGEYAMVDDDDRDLGLLRWTYFEKKYAGRSRHIRIAKNRYSSETIFMHHIVLERVVGNVKWSRDLMCDHINNDKLDNRRSNLRLATRSDNMMNTRLRVHNTSGYTGVSFSKERRKYAAAIGKCGIYYSVGRFGSKEEAAWMRDQWAIELHGEFACLNFDYQ